MYRNIKFLTLISALLWVMISGCKEDSVAPPAPEDTSAPSITISSPAQGESLVIGTNVSIEANVTDDQGIAKVMFFINNELKTERITAPYSYQWETKDLKTGDFTITIKAIDKAGNENSKEINISLVPGIGYAEEFASGFLGLYDIIIDKNGSMLVTCAGDNSIQMITPDRQVSQYVKLDCKKLSGMCVDENNNLIVAGCDKVFRVNDSKQAEVIAEGFKSALDVAVGADNTIYVLDGLSNKIYKINSSGEKEVFINKISNSSVTEKPLATGLCFDKYHQNLYVSKIEDGEVVKYPINSDGTPGQPELFITGITKPYNMVIDKNGNFYLTLYFESGLMKYDTQGNITSIAEGTFSQPAGICFGNSDYDDKSVFVADYGRGKVFKVYVGTTEVI